jgi:hypothetical protein
MRTAFSNELNGNDFFKRFEWEHSIKEKLISNKNKITKQTYVLLIDHQHFSHDIIHSFFQNKRQKTDKLKELAFFMP